MLGAGASEDESRGGSWSWKNVGGGGSAVKLGRRNFMLECPNKMSFEMGCVHWEYVKQTEKCAPFLKSVLPSQMFF